MIIINESSNGKPLKMPWNNCISIGRAYELLRDDLVKNLRAVQKELNFTYCRFHGVFHDDMAVAFRMPDGYISYQWHHLDKAYDTLLDMGLKPFVELNSMPKALASGSQTMFWWKMNVTPPRDYNEWSNLVKAFVTHLIDRYGLNEVRTWYFEVWNEPNLSAFWSGSQEDYWKLYDASALAIKSVDSHLRIGGPATSKASWVLETINHCYENKVPIDFISTHLYPQDEYVDYPDRVGSPYELGEYFIETIRKVKEQVRSSMLPNLEIHWTEWNTLSAPSSKEVSWGKNPFVDNLYAASFIIRNCLALDDVCNSLCYWTASDLFEEGGMAHSPFSYTYGMTTIHGIPKASFNGFKLLKKMRGHRLTLDFEVAAPKGCGGCTTKEGDIIRILLYNNHIPGILAQPTWQDDIRLEVPEAGKYIIVTSKIKEEAGSAYATWQGIGCPHNISSIEEQLLRAHSTPEYSYFIPTCDNGNIMFSFELKPNEVLYAEIRPASIPIIPRSISSPGFHIWDAGMSEKSK